MELTRQFSPEQFTRGLQSWEWLDIAGKTPLFTSPFGDVFFRSQDGYWWLDTLGGTLTRRWDTVEALRADLDTVAGQDQFLLAGLALGAEHRGLVPTAVQVYAFMSPPVFGAPVDVDNIGLLDFVVALHVAGQMHDRARSHPPGFRVTGFVLEP